MFRYKLILMPKLNYNIFSSTANPIYTLFYISFSLLHLRLQHLLHTQHFIAYRSFFPIWCAFSSISLACCKYIFSHIHTCFYKITQRLLLPTSNISNTTKCYEKTWIFRFKTNLGWHTFFCLNKNCQYSKQAIPPRTLANCCRWDQEGLVESLVAAICMLHHQ